jgi:hypothetical protein
MTINVKDAAIKFFNARTGKSARTLPEAATAYYNSLTGINNTSFIEAEADYYDAVNRGVVQAPVTPGGTKTVVTSGQQLSGVAPSGTYVSKVTFTVVGGAITAIVLS